MNTRDYWNKSAAKYAAKPVADQPAYEAKIARLRALIPTNAHVLELGCGSGSTALKMADAVTSWTGTDISREMIRIAIAKSSSPNVRFVEAPADAEVDGAPFDVICAFSLLHLVPDLDAVLCRVRDQLKPGGLFLSKTASVGDMPLPMRVMARAVQKAQQVPEVRFLRYQEILTKLQQYEFEILETRKFSPKAISTFIVART